MHCAIKCKIYCMWTESGATYTKNVLDKQTLQNLSSYIYILYCKTLFILFIYLDWGCIYKL